MLEDALNRRQLRWDDVVRNVEYLGMRSHMKVFLGQWYANYHTPVKGPSFANGNGGGQLRLHSWPPVVKEERESDEGDDECSYDGSCSEFGSEYSMSMSGSRSRSGSVSGSDFGDGEASDVDMDLDLDDMDAESSRRMEMGTLQRAVPNGEEDGDIDISASRHHPTSRSKVVPLEVNSDRRPQLLSHPRRGRRRGKRNQLHDQTGVGGLGSQSESEEEDGPARGRTRMRSRPHAPELSPRRNDATASISLETRT